MKEFMNEDFLLTTETARRLYHDYAETMPIFDFHNHLSAQEIYEDINFSNITQAWLYGDHYKWRAMRTYGFPEELVTGPKGDSRTPETPGANHPGCNHADAGSMDYRRFSAWAETIENSIGNPLYHWTHLELQRYFGITEPLSSKTCDKLWDACNEKLSQPEFSVRNLLKMQNVKALCTTNDPCEDLEYHRKLREEGFSVRVLPTFRPDKAYLIGKEDYPAYLAALGKAWGYPINSLSDLKEALVSRLDYFIREGGCLLSDHSLEGALFAPSTDEEAQEIFERRMAGAALTADDRRRFQGNILTFLGKQYAARNMAMQLHIGALRSNSSRMLQKLGPDTGFDSVDDFCYAGELSALLDSMDRTDELPKTILYCLNQRDYEMLASMCGNFQSAPHRGKIQFGTAWWFCDNKRGMEAQLDVLANLSLLPVSIGMLTDSRSFLSFPRHEYYRRILCNKIGSWVEDGEYPCHMEFLGKMVQNICYHNALKYLTGADA